jgi:acid phosphatase type 7
MWWLGAALIMAATAGCSAAKDERDGTGDAVGDASSDTQGLDVASEDQDVGVDVPPRPTGPFEIPSGPEDLAFHAGPWLGETTDTSVVVSWQTDEPGDSVVEFGDDAGYGGHATGEANTTLHEVRVEGLAPETRYHYRACTGETCTGDLTFATALQPGRPFRFAAYGDTQTEFETHALVSESIRESRPALVLIAGDVVGYGADRESYVTEFFEPARRRGHYIPTYAAPGNHDWKEFDDQLQNFRDYFAHPFDPDVPLPEASYSFSYGDAFFIALDNTVDGGHLFFPVGEGLSPPLWEWLQAQASSEAAQAARWRFAFFHYPPQSACQETWFNMAGTQNHVLPLLQENGFQAVFTGHTHEYEHQLYDRIHVFIVGGGGGGIETDESCTFEVPELLFRQALHHHVTVDVEAEQATVRAVSMDGVEMDRVVLDRE